MKITQLLEGKPFMTEFGIVGYSTVVLIQEDGKNILFDTGNKSQALQLKSALKELGLDCSDISDVVLSHLHFDHVGNVPLFCNASFSLSMTEWVSAILTNGIAYLYVITLEGMEISISSRKVIRYPLL